MNKRVTSFALSAVLLMGCVTSGVLPNAAATPAAAAPATPWVGKSTEIKFEGDNSTITGATVTSTGAGAVDIEFRWKGTGGKEAIFVGVWGQFYELQASLAGTPESFENDLTVTRGSAITDHVYYAEHADFIDIIDSNRTGKFTISITDIGYVSDGMTPDFGEGNTVYVGYFGDSQVGGDYSSSTPGKSFATFELDGKGNVVVKPSTATATPELKVSSGAKWTGVGANQDIHNTTTDQIARLGGTATPTNGKVGAVKVAISQTIGTTTKWYNDSKFGAEAPAWEAASGTDDWTYELPQAIIANDDENAVNGVYTLYAYATDDSGTGIPLKTGETDDSDPANWDTNKVGKQEITVNRQRPTPTCTTVQSGAVLIKKDTATELVVELADGLSAALGTTGTVGTELKAGGVNASQSTDFTLTTSPDGGAVAGIKVEYTPKTDKARAESKAKLTFTVPAGGLVDKTDYIFKIPAAKLTSIYGNQPQNDLNVSFKASSGVAVKSVDKGNADTPLLPTVVGTFTHDTALSTIDISKAANLDVSAIKVVSAKDNAGPITGTWSWKTPATLADVDVDTATAIFTPTPAEQSGVTYAATEFELPIKVVKKITVTSTATISTVVKDYDNEKTIDDTGLTALAGALDLSGVGSKKNKVSISAVTAEFKAVEAGTTAIILKSVTLTGDDSAHYIVTVDGTDEFGVGHTQELDPAGTINQVIPGVDWGNLSQTVGSVGEVTYTLDPTSNVQTDLDAMVLEYEVTTPAVPTIHCDCGEGNLLAHRPDCAYVTDPDHLATCNCGVAGATLDPSIDHETVHTGACAYVADPTHAAACNCGAGDGDAEAKSVNASTQHNGKACHFVKGTAASPDWKTWADMSDAEKAILNALPADSTINVRLHNSGVAGINYKAIASGNAMTAAITLKAYSGGSSGGGSGATTYRVTYDAGEHGALAKGSKTYESVKKNGLPAHVPEVVAEEGWKFVGWTLDGEAVQPAEMKITKATKFVAAYEEIGQEPGERHEAYVQGVGEGKFAPLNNMSRAEAVTMLDRLTGKYVDKAYANSFSDVPADAWYVNFVSFGAQEGIVTGYEDGTFRATAEVSRAEFATMLARFMHLSNSTASGQFSDVDGHWAADAILALTEAGVVDGYEDGTFKPDQSISRAEAVKMINVAMDRVPDKAAMTSHSGDYTNPFTDVNTEYWAYYEIMEAAVNHEVTSFHTAEQTDTTTPKA